MQNNNTSMLVATITPLENMDEINCWENRPFCGEWPKSRYDKAMEIKRTIKKKAKRLRTAYTTEQLRSLERIFSQTKYITSERRREIANSLNITDKSIKIWFQNRRMKEKRSSSESSDTSCDTSGELSPPAVCATENLNLEQTNKLSDNPHENYFPDSNVQAQTFYEYQNDQNTQAFQPPSNLGYGMRFCNDNNIYPTQYYPANENYSFDSYYQNQQENFYNSYWGSHTGNTCQFYC